MLLPRVIIHNAVSVDGRVDWFSADVGLYYELTSRWPVDAHLAGSDTIYDSDEPIPPEEPTDWQPLPKIPNDQRPLLVVPDSRGRVRNWHVLRKMPYWRDLVAMYSYTTLPSYQHYLRERQIGTIVAGDDHVDLRAALRQLHERYQVKTVLVDSGGTLNGVLLRAGLVDEVSLLVHPCLVGGLSPRSMFRAPDLTAAQEVIPLRLIHLEQLRDEIVWLRYAVSK